MAGGFLAVGACISATKNQVIAFICRSSSCFVLMVPGSASCSRCSRDRAAVARRRAREPRVSGALRLHQQRRHRPARSRLFRSVDRRVPLRQHDRARAQEGGPHERKPGRSSATRRCCSSRSAFVVAVVAANVWLRGVRVDLTENNLYTLGEGRRRRSRRHRGADQPLFLLLGRGDGALPTLRTYAARVREMLEEFAARAPEGKLVLNVVDPLPFSEDEDRAEQLGLQPRTWAGAKPCISARPAPTASARRIASDLRPAREERSSSTTARSSTTSRPPTRPSSACCRARRSAAASTRRLSNPSQPWVVVEQAKQVLEVRTLPASVFSIEPDVDVLWIVHPQMLDDSTLYAIDQFIMRGGRALVFVDPNAEISPGRTRRASGSAGPRRPRRSTGCSAPGASSSTRERRSGQPLRAPASAAASSRCAISASSASTPGR